MDCRDSRRSACAVLQDFGDMSRLRTPQRRRCAANLTLHTSPVTYSIIAREASQRKGARARASASRRLAGRPTRLRVERAQPSGVRVHLPALREHCLTSSHAIVAPKGKSIRRLTQEVVCPPTHPGALLRPESSWSQFPGERGIAKRAHEKTPEREGGNEHLSASLSTSRSRAEEASPPPPPL